MEFIIGVGFVLLILRPFWLWYWEISNVEDILLILRKELMEINQKIGDK